MKSWRSLHRRYLIPTCLAGSGVPRVITPARISHKQNISEHAYSNDNKSKDHKCMENDLLITVKPI